MALVHLSSSESCPIPRTQVSCAMEQHHQHHHPAVLRSNYAQMVPPKRGQNLIKLMVLRSFLNSATSFASILAAAGFSGGNNTEEEEEKKKKKGYNFDA